jgi:hypothetical protein
MSAQNDVVAEARPVGAEKAEEAVVDTIESAAGIPAPVEAVVSVGSLPGEVVGTLPSRPVEGMSGRVEGTASDSGRVDRGVSAATIASLPEPSRSVTHTGHPDGEVAPLLPAKAAAVAAAKEATT